MATQLTKNVLDLVPGDVFYKGEIPFTVREVEAPEFRPMVIADEVENVECVAILLSSGNLTGWDHFPVCDTVCTVSPSQYQAWKIKNNR